MQLPDGYETGDCGGSRARMAATISAGLCAMSQAASRSASNGAMVLLPEPDTPITDDDRHRSLLGVRPSWRHLFVRITSMLVRDPDNGLFIFRLPRFVRG